MSLKKVKDGSNMYSWVTHMHSHLGGECSHKCKYCYVKASTRRNKSDRYTGAVRLIENELNVNYGKGKTIFIEHMNDLFAKDVPDEWIKQIIERTLKCPENTYVFQTKNPIRLFDYFDLIPKNSILGTTIESNRIYDGLSNAPTPEERMLAMSDDRWKDSGFKKFLTIEPVLEFDVDILASWIDKIHPDFLNLGADSKGHGLIEPSVEKIMALVEKLKVYSIDLREKHNLKRLTERKSKEVLDSSNGSVKVVATKEE